MNCIFVNREGRKTNGKTVSGIVLALLLTGMLMLTSNVQPVEASGTIYIRSDGSVEPDTAPISTVNNVTYTFTDNINESIVVEGNNIVVDGAGYTLQGKGSGEGITLWERRNVTIRTIKIRGFGYGIYLEGSSQNSILGNTVTTNNAYGIYLSYSSDNVVSENNITANEIDGVFLGYHSSNNSVIGNNITANNADGVRLYLSSNNIVSDNNIAKSLCGNYLYSSSDNSVASNNIANNAYDIIIDSSSNNTVAGNNIVASNEAGIYLYRSSNNNSVKGNNITANRGAGIWLSSSSNNSVAGNNILNNYDAYGIRELDSFYNRFYHNNFVNNTVQARTDSPISVWDDGYPSGGNYWSDYEERYPNATEIDSSGIWDTPYVIDENKDNYPLMEPWIPVPLTINVTIDIIPNTLNLRAKLKYVTAFIELLEGYNISDIDASTILMNGTIPVDPNAPTAIGDYDNDAIPDLMVKFNGTEAIDFILSRINMTELIEKKHMDVTLTVTGKLNDGTPFQGGDTIRIILPVCGKRGIFPV